MYVFCLVIVQWGSPFTNQCNGMEKGYLSWLTRAFPALGIVPPFFSPDFYLIFEFTSIPVFFLGGFHMDLMGYIVYI